MVIQPSGWLSLCLALECTVVLLKWGKALVQCCQSLDWIFARLRSHEQRLPKLCIHAFVPACRPSKGGMGGGEVGQGGGTDRHTKLQRSVNASRVFNEGIDKGLNSLPFLEFMTQFCLNALS